MSEETTEFKPGDVVRLRSGGPDMTISKVEDDKVTCVWYGGEPGIATAGVSGDNAYDGYFHNIFEPVTLQLVRREVAPVGTGAIVRKIDEKHHIDERGQIVKTTNGTTISEDEPTILFRGRDNLAVPLLMKYRAMCVADGCTDYQLATLDTMIDKFTQFAAANPEMMKQPGVTRGL